MPVSISYLFGTAYAIKSFEDYAVRLLKALASVLTGFIMNDLRTYVQYAYSTGQKN